MSVHAEESTNAPVASSSVKFSAWVENGEMVGDEQVRRLYLSVGTTQMGLLVPSGLRVDLAEADRVSLIEPGLSYFMTLRITANFDAAGDARSQALRRYPGAVVVEETTTEALGSRHPMFELHWKPSAGVERVVLLAFVPNAAGMLECSLVAEGNKATEAKNAFVGALQRLQAGERGKFRIQTAQPPGYN